MELDQVQAPIGQVVDRYLLVTLNTPQEVPVEFQMAGKSDRKPVNFCAVLDVSGSMRGPKLQHAKEGIRQALNHLRDGDIYTLVLFEDEVTCLTEPVTVDPRTRKIALSQLDEIHSRGMTALYGGLEVGIHRALVKPQFTNLVLILSDGLANVGITSLEEIGALSQKARSQNLVVSSIGVGADYDEGLLAEIANRGGGRFYHITSPEQISAFLAGELGEITNMAAKDLEIELELPQNSVVMPLSNVYPCSIHDSRALIDVGILPCDLEIEIPIRITLPSGQENERRSISGNVTYAAPNDSKLQTPLNKVTVRYESPFTFTDGVVVPVAEKVYQQLEASTIISFSRARSIDPQEAVEEHRQVRQNIYEYARKLGRERAEESIAEYDHQYQSMFLSSLQSKQVLNRYYQRSRPRKDF
jgi:Mg-chelatase subunit ChlD